MNRLILVIFSFVLMTVSLWGIHDPGNSLEWLLATNPDFSYLRLGMAIGLIMFALFPVERDNAVQTLFKIIGIGFFLHAIAGLISPTYWDTSSNYILPFDFILSTLSGIVGLLAALDMQDKGEAEAYFEASLPPKFAVKLASSADDIEVEPTPLYSQTVSEV